MKRKEGTQDTGWELPEYFREKYSKIGIEYLQMVLSQAEKMLNELVRNGEAITEKTHRILGFSVPILTACAIYLLTYQEFNPVLSLAAVYSILICITSIILSVMTFRKYQTYVIGSSPSRLMIRPFIEPFILDKDQEINNHNQIKNLIIAECVDHQDRIQFNEKLNSRRSNYADWSLYCLLFLPLTLVIATLTNFLCLILCH